MLEDVLSACGPVGRTLLVSEEPVAGIPVEHVVDPGGGQGAAVEAGLRKLDDGPVLVVNADLPCAQPRDLLTLLGAMPGDGLALVAAADGTTNALALAAPHLFAPLYGHGSAGRFLARAARLETPAALADIPNLADDVDTLADLERLEGRLGPRTSAVLEELRSGLPR
jgi:2-phospho-L-lactate guanylyltransferase (CobY/MobA/RfbA family)